MIPESHTILQDRVEYWMPFEGIATITIHRLKDKKLIDKIILETGAGVHYIDIDKSTYEPGNYSVNLTAEGFELLCGSEQLIKKFLKIITVGNY